MRLFLERVFFAIFKICIVFGIPGPARKRPERRQKSQLQYKFLSFVVFHFLAENVAKRSFVKKHKSSRAQASARMRPRGRQKSQLQYVSCSIVFLVGKGFSRERLAEGSRLVGNKPGSSCIPRRRGPPHPERNRNEPCSRITIGNLTLC